MPRPAAGGSGSASDGRRQDPAAGASRRRATAATPDSAQVGDWSWWDRGSMSPRQTVHTRAGGVLILCERLQSYNQQNEVDLADWPSCIPGERCEDRGGRTYRGDCANRCPRSCADLWEHVQCLQGSCHAGPIGIPIQTIPNGSKQNGKVEFMWESSQAAGVQRDSCCRTDTAWRSRTAAALFPQATAPSSFSPKRRSPLSATPGEKRSGKKAKFKS